MHTFVLMMGLLVIWKTNRYIMLWFFFN